MVILDLPYSGHLALFLVGPSNHSVSERNKKFKVWGKFWSVIHIIGILLVKHSLRTLKAHYLLLSITVGYSELPLVALCYRWLLSVTVGCFCSLLPLVALCYHWLLSVLCYHWLLSVTIGYSLLPLVALCYRWLLSVTIGCFLFSVTLGCSLLPLVALC